MLDRRYVKLVALPILAFLAAELLIGLWAPSPGTDDKLNASGNPWLEPPARVTMLAFFFLFCVSSIAVIVQVWTDLCEAFEERRPLYEVFGCCVVAAALLLSIAYLGGLPRSFDLLGPKLFERALQEGAKQASHGLWTRRSMELLLGATNLCAALAVASLITAGISCLGERKGLSEDQNWRFQADRLRTCIYISASFLIVGVLCAKAWTQYPSFLLNEVGQKAYANHVNALAIFLGVEHSILLASFALPVAAVLTWRADAIAERRARGTDTTPVTYDKVIAERQRLQLTTSTQDVLKSLVAVIAPFLTGTIAGLASLVR